MSKKKTPKAREKRRGQLKRLGYDDERIIEILDLEFDLGAYKAPGTPLPGKTFVNGGFVKVQRRGTFKGVF